MRRLLPKSINFIGYDIETFARACPNLQELKLGPLFRADPCTIRASEVDSRAASTISTALSTDSLSLSLSVPVNARKAGASVSDCQSNSSDTIRCLHADLSWINDLLHVYILLSHLTPYFDNLRWFHHITKTDRASLSRTLVRVGNSCNQPSARKKCVDSSSARKKCVNSGKRHNRFFSEGYKWVKTDRISVSHSRTLSRQFNLTVFHSITKTKTKYMRHSHLCQTNRRLWKTKKKKKLSQLWEKRRKQK